MPMITVATVENFFSGCYMKASHLAVAPSAVSLAIFAYLLTLPTAAGRVYTTYGGVYITMAMG